MWQTFYELSAKVLQSLLKLFIIVLLWVKDPSESFAVKIVQMQSKILSFVSKYCPGVSAF